MELSKITYQLHTIVVLSILLLLAQENHGASETTKSKNILFYMGCGSYSMRISVWPLVQALTDKGHHVTFMSAHKSKNPHPGVIDYVPKRLLQWVSDTETEMNFFEMRKSGNLVPFWLLMHEFAADICESLYEDPEISSWIKTSKFDLVFVDSMINDCAFGMAHKFQAKTIILSTATLLPWFYDSLGIPDDSSWAATNAFWSVIVGEGEINFFNRILNAVMPVFWNLVREYRYFPKLEEITRKGLNVDSVPRFSELEKNASLTLLTTHYSQEFARALPPNVVSIGGLAVTGKEDPLPKEIEEFIAKGKDGFIYVSFGTFIEFSHLDKETKDAFVSGLLKFPHIQFIWKAAKGLEMELPENFMVLKWAPQLSLLAHPKIKAFVTHAGLGGINEAIHYGVPMISFPIFAEQDHNAKLVMSKGIGIKLEIVGLQAQELENAITKLTGSSRIQQKMKRVSALFKTRPQSALNTAVWWTEYVLEHDASELAEFLRPQSVNQSWWVRRQLDVWVTLITALMLITYALLYIIKWILTLVYQKLFRRGNDKKVGMKKVKQN